MGKLLDKARAASDRPRLEPVAAWDEDLLIKAEDITPPAWDHTAEDDELKAALQRLGIVDAYRRWCGKSEPKHTSRTEGIMVSCPMPDHPDEHPSAWLNSESNLGTCGSCPPQSGATMFGFDMVDLYALTHGFNVYSYKSTQYREVVTELALDLGLAVRTVGKTTTIIRAPEELEEPEPETAKPELSIVTPLDDDDDEDEPYEPASIDWRSLLDEDSTFLKRWMERCSVDDLPEEYYFWLGFMALGAAGGRNVLIPDSPNVRALWWIVLFGPSGQGKTRALNRLKWLLQEAFPWKAAAPELGGVKMVPDPGSGEVLVDEFVAKSIDPDAPPSPVNAAVVINELSGLMARSQRNGSTLKSTLMNFYDDWGPVVTSSRSAGRAEARDHFCQLVSTTQPAALGRILSRQDNDDGFMNRLIFAQGPSKPAQLFPKVIDLSDLVPSIRGVQSWGKSGRRVTFTPEAEGLLEPFFQDEIVPTKSRGDRPIMGRTDLHMKRICLTMALDQRTEVVSLKIVEQAITLWPYLVSSYGYVEKRTAMDPDSREQKELQDKILAFLRKHDEVKGAQWEAKLNFWAATSPQGRTSVKRAWEVLEGLGMVEKEEIKLTKGRGRPTVIRRLKRDEP